MAKKEITTSGEGTAAVPVEVQRVLNQKERAAVWKASATGVKIAGTEIVLPAAPIPMTLDEGIEQLKRIKEEESQVFEVTEMVEGLPWDALVATHRAMEDIYGVVTNTSIHTMFGDINPEYASVRIGAGDGDVLQVPCGPLQLPTSKAKFTLNMFPGGAYIRGKVNKADKGRLVDIATRAREIMRTTSIYKGKAIALKITETGEFNVSEQPSFFDVSGVNRSDIIFNSNIEGQIEVNIFSPMENADTCRRMGIPLKRCVLLEGPYGTGKTLTARVTAKVATDNGWTFVKLESPRGLKNAIRLSKTVQPMVFFTEDMDRHGDRANEQVNDLVNTLDGIDTKTNEVLVVATTNFVSNIDKSFLRPGRFDAIIGLRPPDSATVERIIRACCGSALAKDADLTVVSKMLENQVPASINEVVKRGKFANMQRGIETISVKDLEDAAAGMTYHLSLIAETKGIPSREERLFSAMKELVVEGSGGQVLEKLAERVEKIARAVAV